MSFTLLLVSLLLQAATKPAPPAPQSFAPTERVPFDAAVRTGTLPNGLTYYIRKNARPEKRVDAAARGEGGLGRREPTTSRGSRTCSSTWRSTARASSSRASWFRRSRPTARGWGRT